MKNSNRKIKDIKRSCQIVVIHVVLLMVLFANEPLRIEGPHAVLYDALAKNLLDVRWTFGLFSKPRAVNTRITFLTKFDSGKTVEWSPVDLEHTPIWDKGHEAIMRNWLDENIGDHGFETDPRLLRDAAKYAAKALAKPDDAVATVDVYKTDESIPAPGEAQKPQIVGRVVLFKLDAKTGEGAVPGGPNVGDKTTGEPSPATGTASGGDPISANEMIPRKEEDK